jgi:hypothetical protein
MKNLIVTLILTVSTLVGFSQGTVYFYPSYESMFILDSLNIPYLPIPERTGISPVGVTYSTQKGVELHNEFFDNGEFDFFPSNNTPSIDLMTFIGSYTFLTEGDKFLVMLFSNWDTDVVGRAKISLPEGKYKSVEILECRYNDNDTYGTIVLLEDNLGNMSFVNSENNQLSSEWQPSFK